MKTMSRLGRDKNIMNNQELPRRALDLSLAIYRVTAKFPPGEVLVGQMRGLGNEIAAALGAANIEPGSTGEPERLKKDIERLRVYFRIAKEQNWVREMNWSVLDFEYYRLEQEIVFGCRESARMGSMANRHEGGEENNITSHNIKAREKRPEKPLHRRSSDDLPLRQDRILKVVQNKGAVKMADLVPLFKDDISERTLRNELQELVRGGLIKKRGANKSTEYFRL